MTKYTPGPWQVAETRHKYDTLIRNKDYDPVASTNFAGYSPKTAAANARLIAAAPDLLEALKTSNDALSTLADCWHCADKVNFLKLLGDNNDAIAKAVGSDD